MNWRFSDDRSWSYLTQRFPFFAEMHGVKQDPKHHAEGDVAEHTQRVLYALTELPEYRQLSLQRQEVLWAAAALHDVEKRSTTRTDDDGAIVSPGHAKRGELSARQILFKDVPTPFAIREEIAALVRHHGLPLWIMDKPDPQKALLAASLRCDTGLLAMLAKADVLGRECDDRQALLERIELFELYCMEQGCWQKARSFPSDLSRFVYFSKEGGQADYLPYDDCECQVTLLCGLPGMGKDRYLTQYCQGLPVVSLDDIRHQHRIEPTDRVANGWVVQQAKEQARELLRQSKGFVWNATNLTYSLRQQLVSLFVAYRARVRIVYIEVPFARWKKQNADRPYPVVESALARMLDKLEVPAPHEAHEVVYFVDDI